MSDRKGPGGSVPTGPGTGSTRDPDLGQDAEKRESLVQLQERYVEARTLISPNGSHANLEWILGARRNVTQDPLGLETRTIELIGLWLQDLATEVGGRFSPQASESELGAGRSLNTRESVAQSLRDATERFLLAFRNPSSGPHEVTTTPQP